MFYKLYFKISSFGNQDVKADYILEDISQLLQIVQSHNAS